MRAPDLTLEMSSGRAFVAETPDGPTAVVLLGRGRMRFTPPDPAERTQVRIFAGDEALVADIDMAFLRFSPAEFESLFDPAALRPRAVDPARPADRDHRLQRLRRPDAADRPLATSAATAGR